MTSVRHGAPGRKSRFTHEDVAGGVLVDLGVHAADRSLYLPGYPDVMEVSGTTRDDLGGRDDYTSLIVWGDDRGPGALDGE